MNDPLNYIDDYFTGRLSPAEKEAFENLCESDPKFAQEVAFMISATDGLKQQLHDQKKEKFNDLYNEISAKKPATISIFRKFGPYMAAASVIIATTLRFLFAIPSPQSLANKFIEKDLVTLSNTMGTADSLQTGIAAYNSKNYTEAERIFKTLLLHPEFSSKALTNLGIVYLVTERYEEALLRFDELSKQTSLQANPGQFYKAVVLMKRSKGDDRDNAKKLLLEVIEKDLPGKREAEVWVKDL